MASVFKPKPCDSNKTKISIMASGCNNVHKIPRKACLYLTFISFHVKKYNSSRYCQSSFHPKVKTDFGFIIISTDKLVLFICLQRYLIICNFLYSVFIKVYLTLTKCIFRSATGCKTPSSIIRPCDKCPKVRDFGQHSHLCLSKSIDFYSMYLSVCE